MSGEYEGVRGVVTHIGDDVELEVNGEKVRVQLEDIEGYGTQRNKKIKKIERKERKKMEWVENDMIVQIVSRE